MDLQFVFGNPTTKKTKKKNVKKTGGTMAKKKAKKKVAKKAKKVVRKSAPKKSGKKTTKKAVKKAAKKTAKKAAPKRSSKKRSGKRRSVKKSKTSLPRFKQRIDITSKLGKMSHVVKWPRTSTVKRAEADIAELEEVSRATPNRKAKKKLRAAAAKKRMALFTEVNKAKAVRESIKKDIKEAKASGMTVKKSKKVFSNPKRKVKKLKRNPSGGSIMGNVKEFTGYEAADLGSLALGGALYSTANKLVAKIPYVNKVASVPVIGNAIPSLLIGVLLKKYGSKIPYADKVGEGLIAASVVGMGVIAGQMVTGKMGLSGVDYTMEGIGEDADFGLDAQMGNDGADFGAIDYTMSGVDYTMEGYGEDADFGSDDADFGMDAQMGEVPSGMA